MDLNSDSICLLINFIPVIPAGNDEANNHPKEII
jgi:hypothetical protein